MGEQIFENFGNESALEIVYLKIVEYHRMNKDFDKAMWYYELLIESLKKKKKRLSSESQLNQDKILKYDYKIFNQLRGHLTVILNYLQ